MSPAEAATAADRFEFGNRICDLPSLPQVRVGIPRVAGDPQADAVDLAEVRTLAGPLGLALREGGS